MPQAMELFGKVSKVHNPMEVYIAKPLLVKDDLEAFSRQEQLDTAPELQEPLPRHSLLSRGSNIVSHF